MSTTRFLALAYANPADALMPGADAAQVVHRNMAIDEVLLSARERAVWPTLRFYINPPSVVLGLSRRIAQDVNEAACRADGVTVTRRFSGGGTVYHDRYVLNVTWVIPWEWLPGCGPKSLTDATTPTFLDLIIQALSRFDIPAQQTRISDVSVGNPLRKIAGSGQARKAHGVLHHASILVDLDLPAIERYLPNPPDRPDIEHRAFITSLKAQGFAGTAEDWGHGGGVGGGWPVVVGQLQESLVAVTNEQFGTTVDSSGFDPETLRAAEALADSKYGALPWVTRL